MRGDVSLGGAELDADFVRSHFEGEDADGPLELDGDVAGEVERQRGLAHAGPSRDDVEPTRQEAGAEPVPAWEAGREPAESLGALFFEGFEETTDDIAGALPAHAGGTSEQLVR